MLDFILPALDVVHHHVLEDVLPVLQLVHLVVGVGVQHRPAQELGQRLHTGAGGYFRYQRSLDFILLLTSCWPVYYFILLYMSMYAESAQLQAIDDGYEMERRVKAVTAEETVTV